MEKVPFEQLSEPGKQWLEKRRRYLKEWNSEIGQMVAEKIVAGDYAFFHDLAAAIERLTKKEEFHSIERLLALDYKMDCDCRGQPFTLKGLRAYYKERGKEKMAADSSKLSKIHHWAKSAGWGMVPALPRQ